MKNRSNFCEDDPSHIVRSGTARYGNNLRRNSTHYCCTVSIDKWKYAYLNAERQKKTHHIDKKIASYESKWKKNKDEREKKNITSNELYIHIKINETITQTTKCDAVFFSHFMCFGSMLVVSFRFLSLSLYNICVSEVYEWVRAIDFFYDKSEYLIQKTIKQ